MSGASSIDEGPVIRRARRSDAEHIGALWQALLEEQAALDDRFAVADDALTRWHNDFPVWLDDDTCRILVAEVEGAVQGFIAAHRTGPPPIYADVSEVYIDELYVAPDARRQGLGRRLVTAVRGWAERVGAERLRFQALAANAAGRAFWAKQQAQPFAVTMTIELDASTTADDNRTGPTSRKIGF